MASTVKIGSGLGPRTQICSINKGTGDHDQAEMDAVCQALALTHTVVGTAGTIGTDAGMHIAVQGTADVKVASGDYATDITLTVVADFKD